MIRFKKCWKLLCANFYLEFYFSEVVSNKVDFCTAQCVCNCNWEWPFFVLYILLFPKKSHISKKLNLFLQHAESFHVNGATAQAFI